MAHCLEFSIEAERDFGLIFDHLLENHLNFGESFVGPFERAEATVLEIRLAAERILTAPYRGERHDHILPGLRRVSIGRAVYWFDANEEHCAVRVLAVFFGGQDPVRHMMVRLLKG